MTPDACVMVKRSDEPWCDDVAASLKFFKCGANHQRFATGEAGLGPAGDENHSATTLQPLRNQSCYIICHLYINSHNSDPLWAKSVKSVFKIFKQKSKKNR